jgi:hypothetical protein
MAITTAICNSFKTEVLNGTHASADVYKAALIKTGHAGTFSKATTNYSALGTDEVANGNGYTTGGVTLAGRAVALSTDTATLDFTDPSWSSATFSADGLLIYNSSKSNAAVAVFLFSNAPVSATNGTFTAVLPAADASNALVRIA